VFAGQPYHTPTYMIDPGVELNMEPGQLALQHDWHFLGFSNAPFSVSDEEVLDHIRAIQRAGQIKPSEKLEGHYNLTIEMETGVGKTYTYIKTMYEFNSQPFNARGAGYFSIDKRSGRMIDSTLGNRRERTSDDADAYDLIMKDKERLLDRRERMDENLIAREEIHTVNVLTVVANESYESFAKGLQSEIAEVVADRPRKVEAKLFTDDFGEDTALVIYESLIEYGYVKRGELTEKFFEDKKNDKIELPQEAANRTADVIKVLDSVYDPNAIKPENARSNTVQVTLDESKFNSRAFQELWSRINQKSYYIVNFDEKELVSKAIAELNAKLRVSKVYFKVEKGEQVRTIESKTQLVEGAAFVRAEVARTPAMPYTVMKASNSVRYDLVGKYSPDWAIAFYEGTVKHIYFVAETKGDMATLELREIETTKAHCAREHFRAISGENVKYEVVDSYDKLWEIVSK